MEEFNISEFIKYYASLIFVVVISTLLGVFGSWYYTENMQVAKYKSQTSLVLTSTGEITQNDISVNKNLVSTYREIIKSRRILSQVIKNLDLDLSVSSLSKMVNVTSANDTELIFISVVDEDKEIARDIANEIAEVFIEDIPNIIPIDNVNLVDKAIKAKEPFNINVLKQYIIGTGAGFVLGSLVVVVMFYFDDSIKKPEDIEEKTGLSVLSTVPKYKKKKNKK